MPFANICPISCIHYEEYANCAFKKFTFKLGRELCAPRPVNMRQNGTNGRLKRKKTDFLLRDAIAERNAGKNAGETKDYLIKKKKIIWELQGTSIQLLSVEPCSH